MAGKSKSNIKFAKMVDRLSDAVFVADEKTRKLVYCNRRAAKLVGRTREQCLKMKADQLHPKDIRKKAMGEFKRQAKNPRRINETEIVTKSGKRIPVSITASKLADGGSSYLVGVFRDVTKRRAMQKELEGSERKFRALASAALDAIVMIDGSGKIIFWNRAAEKMFGYSKGEIAGKPLRTILPPTKAVKEHQKGLAKFRKTGTGPFIGKTIELEARRKGGEVFPMELSLSSVKLDGEWAAIGIMRNITRRKAMERQIRTSNRALRWKTGEMAENIKRLAAVKRDMGAKNRKIRALEEKLKAR